MQINIKNIKTQGRATIPKHVSSILNLNFLAPEIKEAILEGKQPAHLRLNNFLGTKMSLLWGEQLNVFYKQEHHYIYS